MDTFLLDNVILTKIALQPTQKPRSVDAPKLKSKKTTSKKKPRLIEQEIQEWEYTTKWRIYTFKQWWEKCTTIILNLLKQRNEELSIHRYWCIFFNSCLKLTKNHTCIINDISIPGYSPHSGNSQSFKLDTESPSMSEKDIELLYCLIGKLLFRSNFTISEVQACRIYILTRMGLSTNYHNSRHLNIDVLFVKKIWMFVLSSIEDQCTHFETLFSNHKNYILVILQQIIQS